MTWYFGTLAATQRETGEFSYRGFVDTAQNLDEARGKALKLAETPYPPKHFKGYQVTVNAIPDDVLQTILDSVEKLSIYRVDEPLLGPCYVAARSEEEVLEVVDQAYLDKALASGEPISSATKLQAPVVNLFPEGLHPALVLAVESVDEESRKIIKERSL